jgi:hypothetical protein
VLKKRFSSEQILAKLRQIEVQLARKEVALPEPGSGTPA